MEIQLVSTALMRNLEEIARVAPRQRTNYNFHKELSENPNRFLNVMRQGTYVRPHRHSDPPKSESFVLLSGTVAFFIFEENGKIQARYDLSGEPDAALRGIDIGPDIWHSIVVLTESAVCFEVKPGPYAPASDKEFASWAPPEGDPACQEYLARLCKARAERSPA